jgi:hypothetical protein
MHPLSSALDPALVSTSRDGISFSPREWQTVPSLIPQELRSFQSSCFTMCAQTAFPSVVAISSSNSPPIHLTAASSPNRPPWSANSKAARHFVLSMAEHMVVICMGYLNQHKNQYPTTGRSCSGCVMDNLSLYQLPHRQLRIPPIASVNKLRRPYSTDWPSTTPWR